jgi:hypothetical protein
MAKYRLKRKTFGVAQGTLNGVGTAIKNTAGGILEGVGKAADTGVAGTVGGLAAIGTGAKIGSAILPGIGTILGGIGGYIAGKSATRGLGRGLKNAGQDLQM